jgi:pimeloyl-ACP methyl ester carboxylesterase
MRIVCPWIRGLPSARAYLAFESVRWSFTLCLLGLLVMSQAAISGSVPGAADAFLQKQMPPSGREVTTLAGRLKRMRVSTDRRRRYYIYIPNQLVQPVRLLVSVHGISRNAREHVEKFVPLAERWGVVVIAPRFGRKSFPAYQRMRRNGDGERPDQFVDRIVSDVERLFGEVSPKLYLFGYSGGGQFVHRYMMMHPERVAGVVVGAAGWYTFPDETRRFPFGLLPSSEVLPRLSAGAFLKIPAAVVVGEQDVQRDLALNQSNRIDRMQGTNRFDRGLNWVGAMQSAAFIRGLDTPYRFYSMPHVGHDFADAMVRGRMGELAMHFLFGRPRTEASVDIPAPLPAVHDAHPQGVFAVR